MLQCTLLKLQHFLKSHSQCIAGANQLSRLVPCTHKLILIAIVSLCTSNFADLHVCSGMGLGYILLYKLCPQLCTSKCMYKIKFAARSCMILVSCVCTRLGSAVDVRVYISY